MDYRTDAALTQFLAGVWERASHLVASAPICDEQGTLLQASIEYHRQRIGGKSFSDPLAFFYLTVRIEAGQLGDQSEWLGAFCLLYILALDLLDDVQDQDLLGKPYEKAGPAVAVNSGLTLFVLAVVALQRGLAEEGDTSLWSTLLQLLTRAALAASAGQHADLTHAAQSTQEVLEVHRGKGSSIGLIIECAARYAGADNEAVARYRQVAEAMAILFQLVGDVQDLFGKTASPDLMAAKASYPLLAFAQSSAAGQAADHRQLLRAGLSDLAAFRRLLYASGAVQQTAEAVEHQRRTIHTALGALNRPHPALRTWLRVVDNLAALIYTPPWLPQSEALLRPEGPWLHRVDELAERFQEELASFRPPALPVRIPWDYPHWEYEPLRRTVFFPDLDSQADQVVASLEAMLGIADGSWLREAMEQQAPLVLAHELFHAWRHAADRLTRDKWWEEWVATRLAVAYIRHYVPDLIAASQEMVDRILAEIPGAWADPNHVQKVIDQKRGQPGTYGLTRRETAVVELAMVQQALEREEDLGRLIAEELSPRR